MIVLLLGVALAEGLHSGIPVRGVADLGEPSFLTPDLGWTAPVEGGLVKVFVGEDEAKAREWALLQRESLALGAPPDFPGLGDAAWGDGQGYLLVVDGNVAFAVQAPRALERARLLLDAIVDGQPAAEPPRLVQAAAGRWVVEAPGAVAVQHVGGRLARDGSFSEPPSQLVAWDAWGRSRQ